MVMSTLNIFVCVLYIVYFRTVQFTREKLRAALELKPAVLVSFAGEGTIAEVRAQRRVRRSL